MCGNTTSPHVESLYDLKNLNKQIMFFWNISIFRLYITFWNGLIIDAVCLPREVTQFDVQEDLFLIALKDEWINNSEEGYSLFLQILGSASPVMFLYNDTIPKYYNLDIWIDVFSLIVYCDCS